MLDSWTAPTQSIAPAAEKAIAKTINTESVRPSFNFSSQVTGRVRRKLINTAKANGITRSWPKYSVAIAVAMVSSGNKGHVSESRFERAVTSLPAMRLHFRQRRQTHRQWKDEFRRWSRFRSAYEFVRFPEATAYARLRRHTHLARRSC